MEPIKISKATVPTTSELTMTSADTSLSFLLSEHAIMLDGLHRQIAELQAKCTDLQFTLTLKFPDKTPSEVMQKIADLEDVLENQVSVCAELQAKVDKLSKLKDELEEKNNEVNQLQEAVDYKQTTIELLEKQLETSKEEKKNARILLVVKEKEVEKIQGRLAINKQKAYKLSKELIGRDAKVSALSKALDMKKREIQLMEQNSVDAKDLGEFEQKKLMNIIAAKDTEYQEQLQTIQQKDRTEQLLRKKVATMDERLQNLERELKGKEIKEQQLRKDLSSNVEVLQKLKRSITCAGSNSKPLNDALTVEPVQLRDRITANRVRTALHPDVKSIFESRFEHLQPRPQSSSAAGASSAESMNQAVMLVPSPPSTKPPTAEGSTISRPSSIYRRLLSGRGYLGARSQSHEHIADCVAIGGGSTNNPMPITLIPSRRLSLSDQMYHDDNVSSGSNVPQLPRLVSASGNSSVAGNLAPIQRPLVRQQLRVKRDLSLDLRKSSLAVEQLVVPSDPCMQKQSQQR